MALRDPHSRPVADCLTELQTSREGLSSVEAGRRLARSGPNLLPTVPGRGTLRRLLDQFRNVLIYVLLGSALVTAALQHWVDTGVILAVVLGNALIGFVQEGKAEAALEAIRGMLAPRASVLRDGRRQSLDAAELVPGDVVLLEAGDKVPADLRLIEARGLAVQEAILTGESAPVDKSAAPVPPETALAERSSMLWSGTLVARGVARGLVLATGRETEIGRIGGLLAGVEELTTPLIAQMDVLARRLSVAILGVAVALLGYGYWLGQYDFAALFMIVVGLAVAAIPEGLPAVMTVTLALGVQSMARRNAIVRRLPAIEAIGAVSVICTDKTGTLTHNEMTVVAGETPAGGFEVTGKGYAPQGAIIGEGDAAPLAQAALACNDAALRCTEGQWLVSGDPMEGALLAFAGKVRPAVAPPGARRDVLPFDALHRYMAVLVDTPAGTRVYVKGAPERVLTMCPDADPALWHRRAERLAARGLRVLAFAEGPGAAMPLDPGAFAVAQGGGLRFLGLLGMIDAPRAGAIAAVAQCRAAGIRVKMITGDHAGTAAAIAAQIGLDNPARVLTGTDLDRLDDAGLAREVALTDVFARTTPEHKLRLVTALQALGQSVAMTGDGVNDAPALKRADVGIAMGRKGSEAARQASDLVLADDDFSSIAAAVQEGRTVYDNLRKVISFELPTSAGEALTLVLAVLLGLALPVTAVQILWVNLITGITLGIALAFEPGEPGSMLRPPRARDRPLLSGALAWHVVLVTALFLVAVFGVFGLTTGSGYSLARAQTISLNMLVALEVFHLFFIRTLHGASLTRAALRATPVTWAVVAVVIAAQIAVTYVPVLQGLLGTRALSVGDWGMILGAGAVFFAALVLERRIRRAILG